MITEVPFIHHISLNFDGSMKTRVITMRLPVEQKKIVLTQQNNLS